MLPVLTIDHTHTTRDDRTPNSPAAMVANRSAAASLLLLLSKLSVRLTCSLFYKDDLTFSSKLLMLLAQHESSLPNWFSNWSEFSKLLIRSLSLCFVKLGR